MSNETTDPAREIFVRKVVSGQVKFGGEQAVIESHRLAEIFIKTTKQIEAGTLATAKPTGPQLSDCSAPNLKVNHPLNLVSARFGNTQTLVKVGRVNTWLNANPMKPADDESDNTRAAYVARFNREFGDLGWDLPTINVARATFPKYCPN